MPRSISVPSPEKLDGDRLAVLLGQVADHARHLLEDAAHRDHAHAHADVLGVPGDLVELAERLAHPRAVERGDLRGVLHHGVDDHQLADDLHQLVDAGDVELDRLLQAGLAAVVVLGAQGVGDLLGGHLARLEQLLAELAARLALVAQGLLDDRRRHVDGRLLEDLAQLLLGPRPGHQRRGRGAAGRRRPEALEERRVAAAGHDGEAALHGPAGLGHQPVEGLGRVEEQVGDPALELAPARADGVEQGLGGVRELGDVGALQEAGGALDGVEDAEQDVDGLRLGPVLLGVHQDLVDLGEAVLRLREEVAERGQGVGVANQALRLVGRCLGCGARRRGGGWTRPRGRGWRSGRCGLSRGDRDRGSGRRNRRRGRGRARRGHGRWCGGDRGGGGRTRPGSPEVT
ncbi:MAG: hypothetical protein QM765_41900 [Myxococcales bacterium]